LKPLISILSHFFQIQEPHNLIFEPGSLPCTQYTFSHATDYVDTKFYKKLKQESMYV
jgi:hypothetical protein